MSTSISALQRNASAVIRKVAASGQSEEITDRGQVVAVLSPPPPLTGLEKLRAQGLVRPADPTPLHEIFEELDRLDVPSGLVEALWEQRDTER